MQIEKHVASFELSKKLKELGFQQDCAFYWCKSPKDFSDKPIVCTGNISSNYICAAPLLTEIMEFSTDDECVIALVNRRAETLIDILELGNKHAK